MVNKEHISVCEEGGTVKMLTIEPGADRSAPEVRRTAIETLEGGGVIYLPISGFELSERERALISDTAKILTRTPDVEDGRLFGATEDTDRAPTSEDGYVAVLAYVALAEAARRTDERDRWQRLAQLCTEWICRRSNRG